MPKSLIYSYKTMDQSMAELRKKTEQLETIIGEKDLTPERVSRASWKNVQDTSIINESVQTQNVCFISIKFHLFLEWWIIFKVSCNDGMC